LSIAARLIVGLQIAASGVQDWRADVRALYHVTDCGSPWVGSAVSMSINMHGHRSKPDVKVVRGLLCT
jgi:hypothetical protein